MRIRLPETQARYDKTLEDESHFKIDTSGLVCFDLESENFIKEYKYWVLVENKFPYDAIFNIHHMLIPKRVFAFLREANQSELDEYYQIKKQLDEDQIYDAIIENFSHSRSVREHFHSHLIHWI